MITPPTGVGFSKISDCSQKYFKGANNNKNLLNYKGMLEHMTKCLAPSKGKGR